MGRSFSFSAFPVVVPFSRENSIDGFIDLIEGRYLNLSHGNESEWTQVKVIYFFCLLFLKRLYFVIQNSSHEYDVLLEGRENMCLGLSDSDELFSSIFLDKYQGDTLKVTREDIIAGI